MSLSLSALYVLSVYEAKQESCCEIPFEDALNKHSSTYVAHIDNMHTLMLALIAHIV